MGTETVQQPPACSKRTRFNVKQKLWKVALLFCFVLFFALLKMWLDFFFGRMDRDGTEGRPSIFTEVLPPDLILHCWTPKMLFLTTPQVATVICSYICRNLYVKKTNKNLPIMFQQAFECIIFIWNMILENDHTQCNIMRAAFIYCWTEIHRNIKMLSYMSWLEITEQNLTHASVLSKPQHALCS